ncbi:MAG: transposase, partial [Microcoleus sp. PH2017_37_MFU_D_B]|uniref:RNA-guided endonuclease InsQ/TnpB family protein n=1 Tax=Microcoleus sp. PH2017_37_MFU_D_B TaxID=2798847 RepID=UPI001D819FA8
NDFAAGVDLGLNNLVALTSNQPGFIPLLINGRTLKSINQFYNKRSSRLQSQLKGRRKTSPRIQRLTRCRNQKVDNYLHHTSRRIVDILVAQRIGTLVIGKNAQWKTDINLGKQTNQNFVSIPHARLIEMLEYKGFLVGIKVIVQEESFTSKANFLGLDPIPVYGKTKTEPVFTGKRSDVNASYNILRKAIPNAFSDGIGSCVVQPRRVNPLKVKVKGEGLEASHVYK